ncbi:endonuclease [Actinomycetospora sp. TBRC 11914]|uniref:endonuclease n=1 Tax=Actinomycetospora sp. TBRC 11914 TaxID=2729387 RepID=UPI00145C84FE|nr:endonuclease [Actinomycetospora sp. TBRC 11914]NMO90102.1 endonuclease [Actinomycetospora sp. TBRC 11914]
MSHADTAADLLDTAGETFAAEAGITLADKPAPLYRLLVLAVLLSSRVQATLGTRACRELVDSGLGSPERMRDADRQDVFGALSRARFLSKDQTTDALQEGAGLVAERWKGDLRRMRAEADGSVERLTELLTEVPRLGPVGASIFLREVQAVWPELRPHLDGKAIDGARAVGLPTDPAKLAALVDGDDLARFSAALVRANLDDDVAEQVG